MTFRAIQPVHWAGMQKGGPDSPMVCGACPDWKKCDRNDTCSRASKDDYARAHRIITDMHKGLHE